MYYGYAHIVRASYNAITWRNFSIFKACVHSLIELS